MQLCAHFIIEKWITYKLACLTFKAKLVKEPPNLTELRRPHRTARPLRSTHRDIDNLDEPLVKTDMASRAFSVAAPRVWDSLPAGLK